MAMHGGIHASIHDMWKSSEYYALTEQKNSEYYNLTEQAADTRLSSYLPPRRPPPSPKKTKQKQNEYFLLKT